MFSVRVHMADQPGHAMHECREYQVAPNAGGFDIVMQTADGESRVELRRGSVAFIMNQSGKTVDVVRSRPADVQPRRAQLRGGAAQ